MLNLYHLWCNIKQRIGTSLPKRYAISMSLHIETFFQTSSNSYSLHFQLNYIWNWSSLIEGYLHWKQCWYLSTYCEGKQASIFPPMAINLSEKAKDIASASQETRSWARLGQQTAVMVCNIRALTSLPVCCY